MSSELCACACARIRAIYDKSQCECVTSSAWSFKILGETKYEKKKKNNSKNEKRKKQPHLVFQYTYIYDDEYLSV